MKKVLIGIGAVVAFICIILVIMITVDSYRLNAYLKSNGLVGFGKEYTIEITQDSDYTVFEEPEGLSIWTEKERNKMIRYMKERDFKLKAGTYTINTANTFEKALEIFEFE